MNSNRFDDGIARFWDAQWELPFKEARLKRTDIVAWIQYREQIASLLAEASTAVAEAGKE